VLIAGVLAIAYLLGAIPWALIVGKRFFGIDPREHGSGNLGATNVLRLFGIRAGVLTLLLDAAKGALAVAIARWVVSPEVFGQTASDWVAVAAMMAAVVGHSYSPYIGFRGGKGVATSAGCLFVLTPASFLIELFVFIAIVLVFRMVSLGSVLIALTYPALVYRLYPDRPALIIVISLLAVLVIWRHRSNISRIARGQEPKISLNRQGGPLGGREGK